MQTKKFSLLLFFLFIFNSYSQISFEKGYFINTNGEKTECLIKNLDWNNNPTDFEYMISENSEISKKTITQVQEFGITNISKYIRAKVMIDRSIGTSEGINYSKYPEFVEETLFLKTLVSGKADLFSYVEGSLSKYFFSSDNSKIEQLVYKSYYLDNTNLQENVQYKQQLINSLKCDGIVEEDFIKLEYQKDDLMNCFLKYNKCTNSIVENYDTKTKRKAFNISVRPGISESSVSLFNNASYDYVIIDENFGNKFSFRFGVEFEYIFPFNKNKWALIAEPAYQYYKAENQGNIFNYNIDYKAIDVSLGVRHYLFLKNQSKLFVNASLVSSLNFNSNLTLNRIVSNSNQVFELKSIPTISFGFGYKYNNKYSVEFRHGLDQDLARNHNFWYGKYNLSSLIFGYTIF